MSEEQQPVPESPKEDQLVTINTVGQFAQILAAWHANQCSVVKHLLELPEGAEFKIGDEDQERDLVLTGDTMAGFKFGIEMAMMQLGTLPFVAEVEDPAPEPVLA
jgi:hypothetical protein